jgi:hypothetical protein
LFSKTVLTGSGVNPPFYSNIPGFFPGVKRPGRREKFTTHFHFVPKANNERSNTSTPPTRVHGVDRGNIFIKLTEKIPDKGTKFSLPQKLKLVTI